MRRETQNILLVLLGGALLKIALTGTYLRYVKPSQQWLLITGGAIMVLLAVVAIGRDLITARAVVDTDHPTDHPEDHPDEDGGEHHHPARSAWLLVLPVLAVFVVAPPALGSDAVQRAAVSTQSPAPKQGSALFPPLPGDPVVALLLRDFAARAMWDRDQSLNNRAVRLAGFVVHDGATIYVARLAIGCCAADAFPVKVKLEGDDLSGLPNDTWIEVVVTLQPGSATKANHGVPTVTVTSLQQIPAPEEPYEP